MKPPSMSAFHRPAAGAGGVEDQRRRSRRLRAAAAPPSRTASSPARRRAAGHQARARAVHRGDRPGRAALPRRPARSTCTGSPTARTGQGLLAEGAADARAGLDAAVAQPGGRPGRDRGVPGGRRAGRAGVGRQLRRARVAPVDVADRRTARRPTYALVDLDPGEQTTWEDLLVLARLHRTALEHLGVRGAAEGDRAARHPDLGAGANARAPTFARPGPGSSGCRSGRRGRARAGQLEVGQGATAAAWPASTTRRTDQQDAGRAVQPARRRRARRCRSRSRGTSSTTPTCGRTAGRSGPSLERLRERGDPFRRCSTSTGPAARSPERRTGEVGDASGHDPSHVPRPSEPLPCGQLHGSPAPALRHLGDQTGFDAEPGQAWQAPPPW